MTRIKICGITNEEDALAAAAFGADAVGFVFAESPRRIAPDKAREIARALPAGVLTIGVFVNAPPHEVSALAWLSAAQLHGAESPECLEALPQAMRIKAFRVRDEMDLAPLADYVAAADALLLDAYVKGAAGGTGQRFNWNLAISARRFGKPIFLAGGLEPANAAEAVERVAPDWLDVSSGVETAPGRKDHRKIEEFIRNVREADRRAR